MGCVLHRVNLAIQKRKLHMDGSIHIVVQVAQVFKDGGAGLRLSQLITDVLEGNALGECASVNAAYTVRVDGLIRDGGLRRAGFTIPLVLADNGINFFFLGAGELFGLFGFAGFLKVGSSSASFCRPLSILSWSALDLGSTETWITGSGKSIDSSCSG